jgi:hypothetical protein
MFQFRLRQRDRPAVAGLDPISCGGLRPPEAARGEPLPPSRGRSGGGEWAAPSIPPVERSSGFEPYVKRGLHPSVIVMEGSAQWSG